jgi:general secretion pathway protein A
MDLRHLNLREQPFGVTPDPRFLLATETHREALAALLFGIESGVGFMALIATPGMGKTTILFEILTRIRERTRTVFLFQTIQNPIDLVRALLIDLGEKDPQGSLVDLGTRLNEILIRESEMGKSLVVVIDEAQNLSDQVLEAVRMLSNFESAGRKFAQIVLCGQPQLADRLAEPQLLQLRQRISIFARVEPLKPSEIGTYIEHRLKVAGYIGSKRLFTEDAVSLIASHSGGIPRNVNNLCFNALSIAFALKKSVVDAEIVREVLVDLSLHRDKNVERITITMAEPAPVGPKIVTPPRRRPRIGLRVASIAAALCILALGTGRGLFFNSPPSVEGKSLSRGSVAAPAASAALVKSPVKHPPAPKRNFIVQLSTPLQAQPANAAVDSPISAPTTGPAKLSREVRLVKVDPGESLSTICTEQFGECTRSMLERIIALNPQIANPDLILMGEKVAVPVQKTLLQVGVEDQLHDASESHERGTDSNLISRIEKGAP